MPVEFDIWAGRLGSELRRGLEPDMDDEASRLLRVAKRYAPGRLGGALHTERAQVVSEVPYAQITSEGGTIRPKRARWLLIPLPGQPANVGQGPDFVTIPREPLATRFVLRKSTRELVAVRKMSVTIRGTHWIGRALQEHERDAEARLVREGTRRLEGVG